MAIAPDYLATNDIEIYWKDEATLGVDEAIATGWTHIRPTSFTIPEIHGDIEESAVQAGKLTKNAVSAIHRNDTAVKTFDLTLKGDATAIDWVMKYCVESTAEPKVLAHDYAFPDMKDGANAGNSFKILFHNSAYHPSGYFEHIELVGCIITGCTIGQSIDAENGECVITANCMSGYKPEYIQQTITSPTAISTTAPYNIKDNDTFNINDGSAEDLMIYSWELTASRPVERIGCKDYTDFKPFGYAMSGAWEVSGSLVVKRDSEVQSLVAQFNGTATCDINIGKASSGLLIDIPTAYLNGEIDSGGSFLKQNISFKAYSSTNSAGNLFAITTG